MNWRILRRPEMASIVSLLVTVIGFSIASNGKFIQLGNVASVLANGAELAFLSFGLTLVIIQGDIDLSVSSIYGMAALWFVLFSKYMPVFCAFFLVLLFGVVVGWINAFIIVKRGVPALIGTLGMLFFLRGCIYFFTEGFPRSFVGAAKQDFLLKVLAGAIKGSDFRISIFWMAFAAVILYFMLMHTPYGNHIFSVGGDKELARYMGVQVERVRSTNFIICAVLSSFGGMLSAARFFTVAATHGYGLELPAIAATVVGGTLISGGYGRIEGTLIGVLLVSSLRSGLLLSGAPAYWYIAFMGVVLVLASLLNTAALKRWLQK